MAIERERLQEIVKRLTASSIELNRVSDELNEQIDILNETLRPLNLGLLVWVSASNDKARDVHVGYGRHERQWGLLAKDGDEIWHLKSAPRWMRIRAIDLFPQILTALSESAESQTKKVSQALQKGKE